MEQNKKGVSDVVTTVLIIMITVAAIGIIAGFIVPFVKNSLQKSTECKDYGEFYTFDETLSLIESNCYTGNSYKFSIKAINIGTEEMNVSIGRGEYAENYTIAANKELIENIAGMKLILTKPDKTTKSAEIRAGPTSNEITMYNGSETLVLPGPGGIESYIYDAAQGDSFESAEVYPILKNNRICADIKESIRIKPCE